MNPKFPIYIVSKGRADTSLTAKALDRMNVPFHVIVEEQEFDKYASTFVGAERLLILPQKFLDEYDTCDDLGFTKSKGPGAARNFAWQHSINNGYSHHWVMDDNIQHFYRLNRNQRLMVFSGGIFRAAEDFIERYKNIGMAGFNYRFFAKQIQALPPYYINTRIYSCNLINNSLPFRWRGRYNEDTDLSLNVMKAGLCTVLFNAFLIGKLATQVLKGGNTEAFYAKEGTLAKSEMQVKLHPDVSKLVFKFGRWHHHVNYKPFQNMKLVRKPDVELKDINNEYGMVLKSLAGV